MYKLFIYLLFLLVLNFSLPAYSQEQIENYDTYNFEKLEMPVNEKQSVDHVAELQLYIQRKELAKYIIENNEISDIPSKINKDMLIAQLMFLLKDTRKTIDTYYKDSKNIVTVNVTFSLDKNEVKEYLKLVDLRNDMFINLRNLSEFYDSIYSELKKSSFKSFKEIKDKIFMEEKAYKDSFITISKALNYTLNNFDNNKEEKQKIIKKRMKFIEEISPSILKDNATKPLMDKLLANVSVENRNFVENTIAEIKKDICKATIVNILDTDNPVEKSILEAENYRAMYLNNKKELKKITDDFFKLIKEEYDNKNKEIKNSSLSEEDKKGNIAKNNNEYKNILKYKNFILNVYYTQTLSCYYDVLNMYQNHDYVYGNFEENIRVTVLKPDYNTKEIKIIFGLFGKKYDHVFHFIGYEDVVADVYKNKDFIKAIPIFSITDKGKKCRKEIKGFEVQYTGKYTKEGNYQKIKKIQIRDITPFPEIEDYNRMIKSMEETLKKWSKS